jgi:hypothetical protein
MLSQSKKAKEVRKYFIEMEKLILRYHETIKNEMYKKIGLLHLWRFIMPNGIINLHKVCT